RGAEPKRRSCSSGWRTSGPSGCRACRAPNAARSWSSTTCKSALWSFCTIAEGMSGLKLEAVPGVTPELSERDRKWIAQGQLLLLGRLLPDVAHQLSNAAGLIFGNIEFAEQYLNTLLDLTDFYEQQVVPAEAKGEIAHKKNALDYDYLRTDAPK